MDTRALLTTSALGLAAGMRSMTPLAALGIRGAPLASRALLGLGAEGEYIYDKLPRAGARTELPALTGRIVSGALVGRAVAKRLGRPLLGHMLVGVLTAWASTHLFHRVRTQLSRRAPALGVGIGEDLVAIGISAAAVRLLARMSPVRS